VYVFHTPTLKAVLAANEKLKHLEEQLIPHMIRYQLKPHRSVGAEEAASLAAGRGGSGSGGLGGGLAGLEGSMADLSLSGMSTSSSMAAAAAVSAAGGAGRPEWYCGAYLAPEGSFCGRANTLQGYADVNRWASGWMGGELALTRGLDVGWVAAGLELCLLLAALGRPL
jgi:hypothetical protein